MIKFAKSKTHSEARLHNRRISIVDLPKKPNTLEFQFESFNPKDDPIHYFERKKNLLAFHLSEDGCFALFVMLWEKFVSKYGEKGLEELVKQKTR